MPAKTLTQVPLVQADVERLTITPASVVAGVVTWRIDITYAPKDSAGIVIYGAPHVLANMTLTAAQQTTLQNFVVNAVVPQLNTAEGT